MAPEIRIELILTESKSAVLPLHHSGKKLQQIFKEQVCIVTEPKVLATTLLY
jgi:hypothetical protein